MSNPEKHPEHATIVLHIGDHEGITEEEAHAMKEAAKQAVEAHEVRVHHAHIQRHHHGA